MDTTRDAEKERLNKSALLERTLPGELWVWFRNVGGVFTQKKTRLMNLLSSGGDTGLSATNQNESEVK